MPFELIRATETGASIRVVVKLTKRDIIASDAHVVKRLNGGIINPRDCATERQVGLKDTNNVYVLVMIPKEIYGHLFAGKPIVLR